jgi:hypothetical protein
MEVRFQVVDVERLLRADAEGRIDMAASLRIAREIAAFDSPHPVLLDARKLHGRLGTLDMVALVKALLADSERYRRRLAILTRGDDQLQRGRFLETYARNRGIPIAAFDDYEQAVSWLHAP